MRPMMLNAMRTSVHAAKRAMTAAVGLALSLAAAARAEMPAVLDRAPKDAVAVVGVSSIARLDKNLGAMLTAAQAPAISVSAMISVLGLTGIAQDKPIALMLMPGDMKGALPPLLALVPVTDYGAMVKALGGGADGVAEVKIQGDTFHVKQVEGGYAALSPVKALVEGYDGKGGNMQAHAELIGKTGQDIVGASDAFVFFHRDEMKKLMDSGFNPLQGAMRGLASQGLGINADLTKGPLAKDATGMVIGMSASPKGATFDASANYKAGSDLSNAFAEGGDSAALLKELPADSETPLIAWTMDLTKPGMRALAAMMAGQKGLSDVVLDPAFLSNPDAFSSYSGLITKNPGGLFTGFLSRGVRRYGAGNPVEAFAVFRKGYESVNNKSDSAVSVSSTFQENASEINGVSVSAYSMKAISQSGAGSPLALLFGPEQGPKGFVAPLKSAVYATTTSDNKLIGRVIAVGNGGEGGRLTDDKALAQVASALPAGRSAEMYFGVRGVMETILPMLQMGGRQIDYTPPEDLPPIGIAVLTGNGQIRMSVVAPAPTITALHKLQAAMTAPPPNRPGQAAPEEKKPNF